MKTILTIGYNDYILPNSVNVNTLLQSLSKAIPTEKKFHDGNYYYIPGKERSSDLQVSMVKRKLIPEKSSVEEPLL